MECERISEVVKKIEGFKTDDKVDMLINRFEEIMTELDVLGLLNNRWRYTRSAQFVDRLEES